MNLILLFLEHTVSQNLQSLTFASESLGAHKKYGFLVSIRSVELESLGKHLGILTEVILTS